MTGLYNVFYYKAGRGRNLFVLAAFLSAIFFLQTVFFSSPPVFASTRISFANPVLGASQAVDFADVSVVRLVATYEPPPGSIVKPNSATLVQCTGLGVMISSWTSVNGSDQNNWVLTDGSLVNPNQPSCSSTPTSNLTLLRVDLYLNTVFNPGLIPAIQVTRISVHCLFYPCSGGAALLSFATSSNQTFPHVDLANSIQTQNMALDLQLQNGPKTVVSLPAPFNSNAQLRDQYLKEAQRYLTPQHVRPGDATNPLEAGTPIFNQAGGLTALELSDKTAFPVANLAPTINALPNSKFSLSGQLSAIEILQTSTPSPSIAPVRSNVVYENWKAGIVSYYQGDYITSRSAFQKVEQGNALFATPLAFVQLINTRLSKTGNKDTQPSSSINIKIFGLQLTIPDKNMLIVLILIALAVLLVLVVSLYMRARILRRRRVLKDYAEAERQADMEAQRRFSAMKGAQNRQKPPWIPLPSAAPAFSPAEIKTSPIVAPMLCSNCRTSVRPGANFCPNCRMALAPVESGRHIPAMEPLMPPTKPVTPFTNPVVNAVPNVPNIPIQSPPIEMPPVLIPSPISPISVDKADGNVRLPQSFDDPVKEKAQRLANIGISPYIGQRLGNYRIKSLLGYGGFADVYLGEHVFLKTNAAIKVLHTRLTSGDLVNFLTEARTIAGLSHPHIIRVLDFGLEGNEPDMEQSSFNVEGSIPFLIMDYAPGGTLRGRYPKGTRVPLSEIIHYVKQVAEALQYAHGRKLIHRDVKPENMLLSQNNELLLSDFGIVTVAHGEHSMSTQEMAGTVSYIAPEQIKGKPRPASDQYALAVVVYEWLSGIRPFQGTSQWQIMDQHLSLLPTPLCIRIPSLPPAVDNVVLKALEKDPSLRFETISAFADALAQAAK